MRNPKYTTQLTHGTGMINETLSLLSIYQESMNKDALIKCVKENDCLSCKTENRLVHIIYDVFFQRFMKVNPNVPLWLKLIRECGLSLKHFTQLLMVYCARENAVFFDAVTKILNSCKNEDLHIVDRDAFTKYVENLVKEGKAKWSESVQKRNASYVRSCFIDYEMINRKGEILPYEVNDFTILYFMHEQHFAGMSDMAIWEMEEWRLFNLTRHQVLDRIMNLSLKGAYMAQTSGELLTISWNYKSMEEFINATL